MATMDPDTMERLRGGMNRMNPFVVLLWRLGLGPYGNRADLGGQVMVLTNTGRKSGERYRTPVNYAIVDGDVYCAAGFGRTSHWYRNVRADPNVEVWLPDGWWSGVAEEASDAPNRTEIMRELLLASGPAAKMFGFEPASMTEEELEEAVREYPLLRIRRTEAKTGPGGPGDLAWVWPVVALAAVAMLVLRRGKHGECACGCGCGSDSCAGEG